MMFERNDEEVYLAMQHCSRSSSSLEDGSCLSRTERTVHFLDDEDVPSLDSRDADSTKRRVPVASRNSSF
jgi:hypothetical protein